MGIFRKREKQAGKPTERRLPRHIAIILDGNGRWAKKRNLPRTAGHRVGAENFRRIATYCKDIGIEYLTLYAFSTENWKSPAEEVETIMSRLEKYLLEAIEQRERDKVRMEFFGDVSVLSPELQSLIARTRDISKRFEGVQVNICLNYGGRDEIVRAARACAEEGCEISEESMSAHMYSAGIPDPDLVIRPSGEYRLSNFLLWQIAHSELYFTDVLWPDFTTEELDKAIDDYNRRDRRFGGV
ncbi:MAG: di-trans,poly-cis-decaprenylcistransferase [Oscillospiraceae bacterium]|nr:di-trans,poly-cis-decaprenylcistransferase [Oscillospiraceae bacterium]